MFRLPKGNLQFFCLFYDWYGQRCFGASTSNVVSFSWHIPIWFHSFSKHFTKRFPYDWKNPFGYLVTVVAQFLLLIYPCQYLGCFTVLAFGAFMFSVAFVKILKNELRSVNKMATRKKLRKRMYKQLSHFIWSHSNAKQLSVIFL